MYRLAVKRLIVLAMLLPTIQAGADEATWDFGANVGLQTRLFTQDGRWPGQESAVAQSSIAATAELRWRNGDQRAAFLPFVRWDAADEERSLFDVREAYWALEADAFELLVGVNTVFWGVTESVHLVDIVNQTDAAGDVDGEDKLGQPMINLDLQRDWGRIGLYVLPYFRERTFAGVDGRLRTPLPVDTGSSQYESSAGENHVDLALRYSHYVGDVDIGVSLFSGTSREPRLLPNADGTALLPYYDQIDQLGVDLQYTRDAWLWKLEAVWRDGHADAFAAAVGGFEYTFYQVKDSDADIGVLLEYQYDRRSADEPVTIADNDLFVGTRLAMNDTQDTAVLAGVGYDVDSNETFINIEADRRLGQHYLIELRARAFSGADSRDATYTLANDDYLQLQLTRYF